MKEKQDVHCSAVLLPLVCLWKGIEGVIAVGNNAILVRTVGVLQLEIKTLHRCGFSSISDQY